MTTPEIPRPSSYQSAVLYGLQRKPLYYGTVDPAVIAKRRKANKIARAQRKVNKRG